MKNSTPLEKVIELKVCDHAKKLGCLVYKFTSPARRSVPDRLFIMPGGKGCFFIEFKRLGAKPTAAQEIEIAKIRKQGVTVGIIDNVQSGKAFVDDMFLPRQICPDCGSRMDLVCDPTGSTDYYHCFNCEPPKAKKTTMDDPEFN